MATPSIIPNTSTADDPVDTQPDADTGGSSFLDSLENIALSVANTAATSADQSLSAGRLPFDPANPAFGAIRPGQSGGTTSLLPTLLLIFIVWKVLF